MSAFPGEFEEVEGTIERFAVGTSSVRKNGAYSNGATDWNAESDAPLICKPLGRLAITDIPPRPWAYGKFLMFGEAAAIGAVDGGGKGAHAIIVALSMITGRALLEERVWRTGPVAIITYEDKEVEWRRRIAAACLHFGIDYDSVVESFHFISRPRGRVSFAANGVRGGVAFPDGDAIIQHLKAIEAVLLIVDPFNHAHGLLDGNNNALIANVAYEIGRVAEESMAAVLVLHHLRKGAVGDPDDFMGATSLRATFRAVRIFARMTPDQAETIGVKRKELWRYSRIAGSKENYAPPPEFTTWFKLESVNLGNPGGVYVDGDSVGVATLWSRPDVFEGLQISTIADIFDALRIPPGNELRWSADMRSDEWAGNIIKEKAGKDDRKAQSILDTWINKDVLTEGKYRHPKRRKLRDALSLNEMKASEMVAFAYYEPSTE